MITLHQVSKYYGRQDVLKGVSLHVGPGERLGLVGPNGAGKSTLLKLMLGEIEPDQGEVFRARHLRLGHLPQDLLKLSGQTVLDLAMDTGDRLGEVDQELDEVHQALAERPDPAEEAELLARQGQLLHIFEGLGGYDLESRARRTLAGLGFEDWQLEKDVSILSGGWLMRAALARILLSQPDLILLDEPTNHLDLDSLLWLENQLTQMPASLVLVSHDRVFLDKVVNRIVEVADGQLFLYGGNYSQYVEQRESRRKAQQAAYESQQERIREMQRFIDRNRSRKDRAKQVQARLKTLDKMEMLEPPPSDEAMSLELPPAERSAKVVVELLNVDLAYGPKVVYRDLNLMVERGDRMALLGKNGAGKSSLLKLLAGLVEPQGGRRLVGGRVKMGVFSQHALEDLDPERTVLQELSTVAGLMATARLRSILGAFLFKGDEVFKKVKVLSGGERSRLVLAKLLLTEPNLLLLDEPTNHLDLTSRQVLEKALQDYTGTLVLISHDRALINAVANKLAYVAGEGQVTLLPGNYDDFERLWKKRLKEAETGGEAAPAPEPPAAATPTAPADEARSKATGKKSNARKRAEAEQRQARYKLLGPLKKKLTRLEKEVEEATLRLDELVAQMLSPDLGGEPGRWSELSLAHAQVKEHLEEVSLQWENLAMELEEAERDIAEE
ncbi:MAG: ABC-F family ATP-binding cassette domain-containing protein [Deltaproteobacteria bacterium]|nr:ABC-F family ATP-binding cassette domain-containing protein [Deltaproteobacteria bacterium]